MKKTNFIYALAAGTMLLGSCSSNDDVNNGAESNDAAQTIVLQVANAGDGLTTRAGRLLESSEATQNIQHVRVIVCDNNNVVKYITTVDNWNDKGSTPYTDGGHGRKATITIPKEQHLAQGTYTIYAIGYSDGSDYDLSAIQDATDQNKNGVKVGGTFNANTVLKYKENGNKTPEEIFAGNASYSVVEGEKTEGDVVLNRQVAGTFGYVEDIPYVEGATKLELVASASNNELVLGAFGNFDLTGNGTGNDANVKYVVNGNYEGETNNNVVVYSIKLKDWFKDLKDAKNNADNTDGADGLIDVTDNWNGNAAKYKSGSVFAGSFLIPFAKTTGQTFTLRLVNGNGGVLKTWNVNLPESDGQLQEHNLMTWGTNSFATTNVTDSKNIYSVVRNHLYGIGARPSATPDKPGEGGDKPQSLKKAQDITLRVNDNWEVIHSMELE